jgi:tripartite ATP-independent transporter DctP family solute receptor
MVNAMNGISRRSFAAGAAVFASVGFLRRAATAAETTTFKVGYPLPQTHPQHVRMVEAAAKISTASGGRLQLALFPNSMLGGDDSSLSQVRTGAMQIYIGSSGVMSTLVGDAAIQDVGFVIRSQQQALAMMDGPLGDVVRKQMLEKGLYALPKVWVNGFRQIATSTKPIRAVSDLEGLKIRTPGSRLYVDMFKTLGASPATVNPAETYIALQTKVVDAVEVPLAIIEASKWYEPTKYLSFTNHIWGNLYAVVNLEAYRALTPELQSILNREIDRAAILQRDDMLHGDASLRKQLEQQGLATNDITDIATFRARLKPFYNDVKRTFTPESWALLEKGVGTLS